MLLIILILFYIGKLSSLVNFTKTILMIILLPTLIASFFYYLLRPLVQFLEKKKINKIVAIGAGFLIIFALIAILTTFAGRAIIQEFNSFYETILQYLQQAPSTVKGLFGQNNFFDISFKDIEGNLLNSSQLIFQGLRETMSKWFANITDIGTIVVLIPIITFFL